MGLLKEKISSPLEAGPSLLDVQHLPPQVKEALEYASRRLARKAVHVTLVVVVREYQLPSILPPSCVSSPAFSPLNSPEPGSARFTFTTSPITTIKQLVRSGTLASPRPDADFRERWPLSPASLPTSPPPMTPSTASSVITDSSGPLPPNPFGIRLIYANDLSGKEERILRYTIEKAEKKFRIG
jgi:hypothetical protein